MCLLRLLFKWLCFPSCLPNTLCKSRPKQCGAEHSMLLVLPGVALRGGVYDFTRFVEQHPGGARGLLRHAGTDASDVFAE